VRPGKLTKAPEQVCVSDLSHDGRGVARIDGKAVFVDDALPGETVEIQRVRRHRSFDEAKLLRVIEPSPDRVVPVCKHFGVCGGCALQHLAPGKQLEHKQNQLVENLTRIGHVTPAQILEPLTASVSGYRRRARLGVRWVAGKGRALAGFRERGSNLLADLQRCEILRSPLDSLIEPLSALISQLSIKDRLPQVEAAVADNATALVFRVLDEPTETDLEHLRAFAQTHSVQVLLQPGGYDTIRPLRSDHAPLVYALPEFAVTLEFQPSDFIQINSELNQRMVSRAIELLSPAATDRVLDLFCGIGNFSLPLARRARQVLALEGDAQLVARAKQNAVRNGLQNVQFMTANLASENLDAPWTREHYDRVLLDPPRAGAKEVLPVIAKSGATRLVYISCHPGSFARDAGILVKEHGFTLSAAGVMDMFPHTAHVESIGVFER
jgi:23S rRNA (uracil1939-C5)-methyltransferase